MEAMTYEFRYGDKRIHRITTGDTKSVLRWGDTTASRHGDIHLYIMDGRRWQFAGTFHGGLEFTTNYGMSCDIRGDWSGMDGRELQPEKKLCSSCKEFLPLRLFNRKGKKLQAYCRRCQRSYSTQQRLARAVLQQDVATATLQTDINSRPDGGGKTEI